MATTKIILDADVIIHFAKGGCLHLLPNIFKGYEYAILDVVYDEILYPIRNQLDNQIGLLKNINRLPFNPKGEIAKEYALLRKTLGKGESACLIYCRYNHDVIGSSNLKDITRYCDQHQITYLTTLDFLYYGIRHRVMTLLEANQFIADVRSKDSKLPEIDMAQYIPTVTL